LQVAKDGDPLTHLLGALAHHLDAPRVELRLTVGEVDTHHIGAGSNQLGQHFGIVSRGAESRQYFCTAKHKKSG
jgi:hypothetical protein